MTVRYATEPTTAWLDDSSERIVPPNSIFTRPDSEMSVSHSSAELDVEAQQRQVRVRLALREPGLDLIAPQLVDLRRVIVLRHMARRQAKKS